MTNTVLAAEVVIYLFLAIVSFVLSRKNPRHDIGFWSFIILANMWMIAMIGD